MPAIGWTGVVLLPWLRWRQMARALDADDRAVPALLTFPKFVGACALGTSTIGYIIGALQLIAFAHLPTLEALKVSVQGPVLGAVLSVAAYLEAERAVRSARPPIVSRLAPTPAAPQATSTVAWKIRYITITIALGAATPIFFFGLTREQGRLEELRGLGLLRPVSIHAMQMGSGDTATLPLRQFGAHTQLYVVQHELAPESAGVAVPFARAKHAPVVRLGDLWIDAPRQLVSEPRGWYASRFDGHRVIAFQHTGARTVIAVSPLADYGPAMFDAWLAAAAVGGVALAVAFLLSLSFARSVVEPLETQSAEARALADRLEERNAELRVAVAEADAARSDAEAANRLKSVFLANMSHELRTPLNAIQGYAELLELGLRGPVTPDQRDDLRRIQRNEQHLLSVINDVLDFARLEAGRVTYAIAPVPIAQSVASTVAMLSLQFKQAEIHLVVEPIAPECVALADADKVRQVLLNLLSNAVKFTGRGGTITISAAVAGDRVIVRVRDTGPGIPSDQLEAIFEPFVQADASLTRRQQGSGLGLSISRGLLNGMGGDLEVEASSSAGSTFRFVLPLATVASTPRPTRASV